MKHFLTQTVLFFSIAAFALEITPEGGIFIRKTGENVKFHIQLDKGRENCRFSYTIRGNRNISKEAEMTAGKDGKAILSIPADRCGFIYVQVKDNNRSAEVSVAVDPQNIRPGRKKPEIFDKFWENAKKELNSTALSYESTRINTGNKGKNFKTYEVKINLGGEHKDAYGMLTIPVNAVPGRHAARLLVCGAGCDKVNPHFNENNITFILNPMSVKHDGPMGATVRRGGKLAGYTSWGMTDPEKNYFIGMFKRVYSSLRLLKSLPEWDQRTLIVSGHSQGGGQALAAAGLDPDVTLCIAHQPALCNHGGWENGTESGWPTYHYSKTGYQPDPEKALKVLDLIDGCFFASNIKDAEVHVFAGYLDRVCVASSVYSAYNMIPSKNKVIVDQFDRKHIMPMTTIMEVEKIIEKHIRKMQADIK